jgi:uncharacterized RmlC-like cupin family protein
VTGEAEPVRLVGAGDRVPGHPTPGMVREEAVATAGMWAGFVRTAAGAVSAWHHHGDYESSIFVVAGRLQMESGPGGAHVLEAGPGDFLYVSPGAVHREANPGTEESHIVVVRAGSGPAVINVDGPAGGGHPR